MENRITKPWQDILMHDATGVDTADPMLVDYLLAKVDTPQREALLRRYQGQHYPHRRDQQSQDSNDDGQRQNSAEDQPPHSSAKERSRIKGGLRAIRAVIVKDTVNNTVSPSRSIKECLAINEKIRQIAGLSWEEYQKIPDDEPCRPALFQSTRPAWGETLSHRREPEPQCISLRSPRMGRDEGRGGRGRGVVISIHSPRMGRDLVAS